MVANYADGKRRFDSYATETDALEAADKLARQIDRRDYVGANMTREQAIEYSDAVAALQPFNVTVRAATSAVAECLKTVGDLSNLHAAVKFYAARHKQTVKKSVADLVAELLQIKRARGASSRYMGDLESRLQRFAADCRKDACNVTTGDIQSWLDALKLSSQSYHNFRRVLHLLLQFAVARGYAADNPVAGTEKVKIRNGEIGIFHPDEIAQLLTAADEDFQHHCAFGFWLGEMVLGAAAKASNEQNGIGRFGRITTLADLPGDKQLLAFINKAVELNESGAKRPAAARSAGNRELIVPDYFTAALKKNKKALAAFEAFSYSHKKEYVEWITEAKREETRQKRIETMLTWLSEVKSRNWKYANC